MKITGIRLRDMGFSETPDTLEKHTVTNTSILEDHHTRTGGWFGPAVWTLVEVFSDDGHVGVGTAGAFHGAGKDLIARYYADLVLGEDPRLHERLWQRMYRSNVRFGRSGSAMCALSALDIACWDLHARAEDKRVVDLLGGEAQTQIPVYASRLYALEDLEALKDEARGYVRDGFTAMKMRFAFAPRDGLAGMSRNVEYVEAVRAAIGPDIQLAADAYMGWDLSYTMQITQRLREYGLWWIEEPLMPHELDGYAELNRRLPWQRWSSGEHSYTKWEFKQMLDRHTVDVWQPDANRVGGITEMRKICALAEAAGTVVIPHSNEAHNLQVVFSQAANVCPISEYFPDVEPDTGNELFWRAFTGNPTAKHGTLQLGSGHGLGIEVNEDTVSRLQHGDTILLGAAPGPPA